MATRLWGREQLVNITTVGTQDQPQIARLTNGNIVVVWEDFANPSNGDIKARIYAPNGSALTGELLIAGNSNESSPAIAATANGGFSVSCDVTNGIMLYAFTASGAPTGPIFASSGSANTHIAGGLSGVQAVVAAMGSTDVTAYFVSADGTNTGSATVNTNAAGLQYAPDVVRLTNGNVVIAWVTASGGGAINGRLSGSIYGPDGAPLTGEFQISSATDANIGQEPISLTALSNGGFVASWAAHATPFGNGYDLQAVIFTADGQRLTGDLNVNTRRLGDQRYAETVGLLDGGFLTLWVDSNSSTIRGQRFSAFGDRVDGDFLVSTEGAPVFGPRQLSASLLADGRVAVTWAAFNSLGDAQGVHLQMLDPRDGNIEGTSGADTLYGSDYSDQIAGLAGDDVIYAGAGDDTVLGGLGNDTLVGQDGADRIYGQGGDDALYGEAGDDALLGGLGNDAMSGGPGNDAYEVTEDGDTVFEMPNEGTDTVYSYLKDYMLGPNLERLELENSAFVGRGNALDNTIIGTPSNNVLIGGAGNDTMIGGAGDDAYEVTEAGDVVIENPGEGTDTVYSYLFAYTLPANVERLEIVGPAQVGTGNALNNTLIGNALRNYLNGGAGDDTLTGGGEVDTFYWLGPSAGRDVITDFAPGSGEVVNVASAQFASYAAVQAAMAQVGSDVVITLNAANTLTLQNVLIGSLSSANFSFYSGPY